jgi:nucleoid DNA-binding protein
MQALPKVVKTGLDAGQSVRIANLVKFDAVVMEPKTRVNKKTSEKVTTPAYTDIKATAVKALRD